MNKSFAYALPGPLLAELLAAQRRDDEAVAYPAIEQIAEALVERAQDLHAVVWPVGRAAERVAGAATLLAEGDLAVGTWNTRLDGERVLLFAVSGTTSLNLAAAAAQVRSMGATEIHACGVDVVGAADSGSWESYTMLTISDRQPAAMVD
jgi:hypothetical protein